MLQHYIRAKVILAVLSLIFCSVAMLFLGYPHALALGLMAGVLTALYHSAVNYTSLGYGDLIMSLSWRLLGPLETANGALLFGVSTAMVFAVTLWLIQTRFTDLKE